MVQERLSRGQSICCETIRSGRMALKERIYTRKKCHTNKDTEVGK
jgi:hypothetical protein